MDMIIMLLQRAAVSAADTVTHNSEWVTFGYWVAAGLGTALVAFGATVRSAIVFVVTKVWLPREQAQASMLKSIEDYMEVTKHTFPQLSEKIDSKLESIKLEIRENRAICQKVQVDSPQATPSLKAGKAHA